MLNYLITKNIASDKKYTELNTIPSTRRHNVREHYTTTKENSMKRKKILSSEKYKDRGDYR